MSTRRLEVVISGDPSSLSRALGSVQRDMGKAETASEKLGRRFGSLARSGALAAGALIGVTAGLGVRELIEGEKAAARTQNVIETTGGAANVTAQEVADLSSRIQDLTGSEDDQIQTAANLILTFKQIRNEAGAGNDIFDQAVAVTNDLSVALGKDLNSSALMVGKALNDPIKGLTALGRAGVQFTEEQREQIAAMVESGNVIGAQKIILAELTGQVGGAAAAEGEITEATQRAQRQFEDMAESLVARVLPAVVSLGNFVTENARTLGVIAGALAAGGAAALTYAGALRVVSAAQALSAISSQGLLNALSLSGPALLLTAGAIAGVGLGYLLLRDRTNVAADALRQQIDLNRQAADSHRATADAVNANKDALDRLTGAEIGRREAAVRVEEATLRVAEAERAYGRGSVEHRRALLDLERAEQGVTRAREDHIRAATEGIETTKAASAAIDKEARDTRAAADSARQKAEAVRRGIITGEEAERVTRELSVAQRAEARASETAAEKHAANARRARELAAATGSATPRARELRARLIELAETEMDLSHFVAAMNAVRSAASSASAAVTDFASRAAAASRVRAPGGGGGGGGASRTVTTTNPYRQDQAGRSGALSFPLAPAPVGSPVALTRLRGRRGRIETTARANAERDARAAGGDEDAIREAGERAELQARRESITKIRGQIRSRRNKLVRLLAKFDISARRKVKIPKKGDERAKSLQRRANMKQREEEIRDELETLAADWADLAVQAREVGDSLEALDRGDEAPSTADSTDPSTVDAGPTERDSLEANAALAALTPGSSDDIAAASGLVGLAERELAEAQASGDPRRVRDAANALVQARQSLAALNRNTDALNANTKATRQAFGGSVAFSFRGQMEVLRSLAMPSSDRLAGAEVGI